MEVPFVQYHRNPLGAGPKSIGLAVYLVIYFYFLNVFKVLYLISLGYCSWQNFSRLINAGCHHQEQMSYLFHGAVSSPPSPPVSAIIHSVIMVAMETQAKITDRTHSLLTL